VRVFSDWRRGRGGVGGARCARSDVDNDGGRRERDRLVDWIRDAAGWMESRAPGEEGKGGRVSGLLDDGEEKRGDKKPTSRRCRGCVLRVKLACVGLLLRLGNVANSSPREKSCGGGSLFVA
jgi:hypothetical protein